MKILKRGIAIILGIALLYNLIPINTHAENAVEHGKIKSGGDRIIVLKNDGSVWTWGINEYGQLGDGTTENRKTPIALQQLKGAIDVDTAYNYSLILLNDGTVWEWGYRWDGIIGNNVKRIPHSPKQVNKLNNITKISTSSNYSLALKKDGTVWAWGLSDHVYFGKGLSQYQADPCQINGLVDIVSISCGPSEAYALKNDGTLWALGANWMYDSKSPMGSLGVNIKYNDSSSHINIPRKVETITDVKQIFTGSNQTFVIKKDGTVWAWGINTKGEFGVGPSENYHIKIPVQMKGMTGAVDLAIGGDSVVIMKKDGTLWSCGDNESGDLGDGSLVTKDSPVQITKLNDIIDISGCNGYIAMKKDGTIWTWGAIGNVIEMHNKLNNTVPMYVKGFDDAIDIAAGSLNTAILRKDGTVWTCGNNRIGQLGVGTSITKALPTKVAALKNIKMVSLSHSSLVSIALSNDGKVWYLGIFHDADYVRRSAKAENGDMFDLKEIKPAWKVKGLDNVVQVSAGGYCLALKKDGSVWQWGEFSTGLDSTPKRVEGLTGITTISAGGSHSLALRKDGTVWAWGNNKNDQCGDRDNISGRTGKVKNLDNVIAISAGGSYSLALKKDGTVWAWGSYDDSHEGTFYIGSNPKQVNSLESIDKIAAGTRFALAVKKDGTVWRWGLGFNGCVVENGDSYTMVTTQVKELSNIKNISVGSEHLAAVSKDGKVYTWGNGFEGQLGNGIKGYSESPYIMCNINSMMAK